MSLLLNRLLFSLIECLHCSIVAIHGLDGHREDSWTVNGVLWLRDLLPEKVPRARILTYGYDAYTRGRDQLAEETIYDLAKGLVSALATERRVTNVSHSMYYWNIQSSSSVRQNNGP